MKRDELFNRAEKHRKKGKGEKESLDTEGRQKMREELIEYLKSEEGQRALRATPKVTIDYGNGVFDQNFPLHEQPIEKIADLIMQEVE